MSNQDSFLTLAARGEAETRVRGSRFVAVACPADGEEAARAELAEQQRVHFDATHHCSAWRFRDGTWRANDAGEPSGSAGAPILAAIDGAGLQDCVVVVVRYFGGTKLGVGGLVRAYGEAASLALAVAPRRRGLRAVRLRIRYPYEHTSAVMRALEQAGAEEVEHGYAAGGAEGEVTLSCPSGAVALLGDALREQTGGAVAPEALGSRTLFHPVPGDTGFA